jgi:hypothetical protein
VDFGDIPYDPHDELPLSFLPRDLDCYGCGTIYHVDYIQAPNGKKGYVRGGSIKTEGRG